MNHGPLLLLGIFFTFAWSWYGLIFKSQFDLGRDEAVKIQETGQMYPLARGGASQEGLQIYRANGCVECHTQQVRPRDEGSDFERGWGKRPTVGQDHLYDHPVLLGSVRIGPDLMNIGSRQTSEEWHLLHLYNPRITSPGSSMPRYPYLFEKRKLRGNPSPDSLKLPPGVQPPAGYEIVPRPEARALVAYMLSLQAETSLFEAPLPQKKGTNSLAGTNAMGTNVVLPIVTNQPATK